MKKVIISGALALTLALGAGGFTAFASGFDDDTATVEAERASRSNNPQINIIAEDGPTFTMPTRPGGGGGGNNGVNIAPEPAV